ncbi:MAG: hypothetical protein DRG78_10210 [Epsilonproteobacteria bacterium]|nr:MAG: hypothetical protein DRG78_10210 [Campylobacterota bacterium]
MESLVKIRGNKVNIEEYYVQQFLKTKNIVLHVAAPKSGSTWFDEIIRNLHKFKMTYLIRDGGRREQEIQYHIFLEKIKDVQDGIYFCHQHVRASQYTIDFIELYDIKVILQIRNIFDTVLSIRDHFLNEGFIAPMGYADNSFLKLSQDKQLDMIIDLWIPWYFNFYTTWFEYIKNTNNKNIFIIEYEKMKSNVHSEVDTILQNLSVNYTQDELDNAINKTSSDKKKTRKNKAIIGRGESLSEQQRDRIYKFAGYYLDIDFSLIGIEENDKII